MIPYVVSMSKLEVRVARVLNFRSSVIAAVSSSIVSDCHEESKVKPPVVRPTTVGVLTPLSIYRSISFPAV